MHSYRVHPFFMAKGISMDKEYWKKWIIASGIRAIKTFCQTCVAMIGTSLVLTDVNWELVLSASALAFVLSMLTSLAGLPELGDDK